MWCKSAWCTVTWAFQDWLHFAWVVDDAKCIVVMRVCVSVSVSVCLSAAACLHACPRSIPSTCWVKPLEKPPEQNCFSALRISVAALIPLVGWQERHPACEKPMPLIPQKFLLQSKWGRKPSGNRPTQVHLENAHENRWWWWWWWTLVVVVVVAAPLIDTWR